MFRKIYSAQDRWRSPADIWLRAVEAAGDLARVFRIRENMGERLPEALTDLLVWLFSTANRLGFDLGSASWAKFPALCPYCYELGRDQDVDLTRPDRSIFVRVCVCNAIGKARSYTEIRAELAELRQERLSLRPTSLSGWQDVFNGIYGRRHGANIDQLAFHFVEEVGEVARELRYHQYLDCQDELADMFSWVLSLANAAGRFLGANLDVADALWRSYPGVCKHCGANPCQGTAQGHRRPAMW
jgi:NTP pyrophosphatase (non-canonical NTP hydrolase)